ncbi:MAG: hypothetical protein NVS3B17_14110 [Vulcanimicrobiaceae bacterium]
MGVAWPDLAIGLILLLGTLAGFKRGLIDELAGLVALGFAIVAAFAYGGTWDAWLHDHARLGVGSAHIVGLVLYAAAAYAVVRAIGAALSTVAKLPIVGTANALAGAAVGFAKAAVFLWAIVYVALFFPLNASLRDDLHQSRLVAFLELPNGKLDENLRRSLPFFVQPFAKDLFERHRV